MLGWHCDGPYLDVSGWMLEQGNADVTGNVLGNVCWTWGTIAWELMISLLTFAACLLV
jgi:hypothetical protein